MVVASLSGGMGSLPVTTQIPSAAPSSHCSAAEGPGLRSRRGSGRWLVTRIPLGLSRGRDRPQGWK